MLARQTGADDGGPSVHVGSEVLFQWAAILARRNHPDASIPTPYAVQAVIHVVVAPIVLV